MALRKTEEFLNERRKQIKQLEDNEVISDFEKSIKKMISSIKSDDNSHKKKSRSKSREDHRNPFEGFLKGDKSSENKSKNDEKQGKEMENPSLSSFRFHIRRDSKQLYQEQKSRDPPSRLSHQGDNKNSKNNYQYLRGSEKGGSSGTHMSRVNPNSEFEKSKRDNSERSQNILAQIEEQVREYEEQKLKKKEQQQREASQNEIQNFYRSKMSNSGLQNQSSKSNSSGAKAPHKAQDVLKKNQEILDKIITSKENYDQLFHNGDKSSESKRPNELMKSFWNKTTKQDEHNARGSRKSTYY